MVGSNDIVADLAITFKFVEEFFDQGEEFDELQSHIISSLTDCKLDNAFDFVSQWATASRQRADRSAEAALMLLAAKLHLCKDNLEAASEAAQQSEAIFKELGDCRGEAMVLVEVARDVLLRQGDFSCALMAATDALSLFRSAGDVGGEARAFHILAQQYLERQQPTEALSLAASAVDHFDSLGDSIREASALLVAVDAHLMMGEMEDARNKVQRALTFFQEAHSRVNEPAAWRAFARVHLAAGNSTDALRCACEAARLATQIADLQGEAAAHQLASEAQLIAGATQDSLAEASKAVDRFRELKNKKGESATLFLLFRIHLDAHNHGMALVALKDAIKLHWEMGDKLAAASCMRSVAHLHLTNGFFDAALMAAGEALSFARECDDRQLEAASLHSIALVRLEEEDVRLHACSSTNAAAEKNTKALRAALDAVAAWRELQDPSELAKALHTLANVHLMKQNSGQAVAVLCEAQGIQHRLGDLRGEANSWFQLAVAYLEQGQPQRAADACREAQHLFENLGDSPKLDATLQLLRRAHDFDPLARSGLWNSGHSDAVVDADLAETNRDQDSATPTLLRGQRKSGKGDNALKGKFKGKGGDAVESQNASESNGDLRLSEQQLSERSVQNLYELARSMGADAYDVWDAMDSEYPKASLIRVLLK